MSIALIIAEVAAAIAACITFMYPVAVLTALLYLLSALIGYLLTTYAINECREHDVTQKLSDAASYVSDEACSLFNRAKGTFA